MGYLQRGKVLINNRRISISFRESALYMIFETIANHIHSEVTRMQAQQPVNLKDLETSFSIFEKCLSYDFYAIMLNDTVDDPSSTYIPTTWRPVIERPQTMQSIFHCMRMTDNNAIRTLAFKCMVQFANMR